MALILILLLAFALLIILFAPEPEKDAGTGDKFREVRGKLGFFGWLWRLLLFGWQILMAAWFLSFTSDALLIFEGGDNVFEMTGATIGISLSWGIILSFWTAGTVILGLFTLLTRPARALVLIEHVNRD